MELNLSPSVTHNIVSTRSAYGRQLLEGFNPSVQLKETRSAYFINVNLSGFRKEDIKLEMDNSRTLVIRGQRFLEDLGRVEWTWHLMESGGRSYRKPFKIPNNVNVGGITGSFHQGVLHVLMPKFRWTSRFAPYHINRFNSQDIHDHRNGCAPAGPVIRESANPAETNVAGEEANVHDENEDFHEAQDMDDLVGTQSDTLKETEQTAPAINSVEEEHTPPKSMEFREKCPSDIDPPKEIRNPHDDQQQVPLAEERTLPKSAISSVEEELAPPKSMEFGEKCPSHIDPPKEIRNPQDDEQQLPLAEELIQLSLSSPALQQRDPPCSASEGHLGPSEDGQKQPDAANEMAHRPDGKEDAEAQKTDSSPQEINVEGSIDLKEESGPPTTPAEKGDHKEEDDGTSKMAHHPDQKEDAEAQQRDSPPREINVEGSIVVKEELGSPTTPAEEGDHEEQDVTSEMVHRPEEKEDAEAQKKDYFLQESNLEGSIANKEELWLPKILAEESDQEEVDSQKLTVSKEKDDSDENFHLNLSEFFSSRRTKIMLAVALSSVALITAYKIIRRRS